MASVCYMCLTFRLVTAHVQINRTAHAGHTPYLTSGAGLSAHAPPLPTQFPAARQPMLADVKMTYVSSEQLRTAEASPMAGRPSPSSLNSILYPPLFLWDKCDDCDMFGAQITSRDLHIHCEPLCFNTSHFLSDIFIKIEETSRKIISSKRRWV